MNYKLSILVALFLGSAAVMQAGMNRNILEHWGILPAVLLNSLVLVVITLVLYIVSFFFPSLFPASFKLSSAFSQFRWWYFFPGVLGFCLVMVLPIVVSQIGATKTFIYLIVAQMLSSLIWDIVQESIPLTPLRIIAVLFALLSITLITWEK